MEIYSNIEKSKILNKKYRNINTQKDKKLLEKLKDIIELSTKIYFFILILILILDYSLMVNLFNIETGYFSIILSENGILPFNFLYIFLPFPFIFLFIFSGVLSLQLSLIFQNIVDELSPLLNKINIFRYENKKNTNEKFQEIYKLIFILIVCSIIVFFLDYITNIIGEFFKNTTNTFTKFFIIIMIEFIVLKSVFSFLSLYYLKSDKFKLWFEIFIVLIMYIFLFYFYYFNKSNYFILFLYILYHMFAEINYTKYFNKKNALLNKRNEDLGTFFKIIAVFFIIIIYYSIIDSDNMKKWSQSIEINHDKKAFLNGSFNLIFNRGLLLNNKELINIKISEQYLKYLDISSAQYLKDNSCGIYNTGIVYEFLDGVQYLQLGKNLRMYFKTINLEKENKTLIFIIKKEQEKIELIELSEYKNKVDKK
ncbi:hypothetical protein ACOTV5_02590 [Aliarcobacter butzleri]